MTQKVKKGEVTKARILASAYKLFQQQGFEATPVHLIVADAGCAKGTFYLYFETKMDLLHALAQGIFDNFARLISDELSEITDDPFAQVERLFNTIALHMVENEAPLKLIHTYEMLRLIEAENLSISFINELIGLITVFLDKGIEQGSFRPVNTAIYGKIIFSLGHDMLESAMLTNFPSDVFVVKDELMIIVRKILIK